jgi:hypothetical protein
VSTQENERAVAPETPGEMLERAQKARGEALLHDAKATALERAALQYEHEAALWELAYEAGDALDAELERKAGLEAAYEGAEAAWKDADKRQRRTAAHKAKTDGELQRLAGDLDADPDAKDDAVRVAAQAERDAARAQTAFESARQAMETARDALQSHERQVQALTTAYATACRRARNPGKPAKTVPARIRVTRPEDMSDADKALLANAALLAGLTSTAPPAPKPQSQVTGGANWRAELAAMDPSRSWAIRHQGGTVIIPPVPSGTR